MIYYTSENVFCQPQIENIKIIFIFYQKTLDKIHFIVYNILVRQREPLKKGSEEMDEMQNTEYILRMVLELIEKCETLDELKQAILNVLEKQKKSE